MIQTSIFGLWVRFGDLGVRDLGVRVWGRGSESLSEVVGTGTGMEDAKGARPTRAPAHSLSSSTTGPQKVQTF